MHVNKILSLEFILMLLTIFSKGMYIYIYIYIYVYLYIYIYIYIYI